MPLTVTWAPLLDTIEIEALPTSVDMESLMLILESKKCGSVKVKDILTDKGSNKVYAKMASVEGINYIMCISQR